MPFHFSKSSRRFLAATRQVSRGFLAGILRLPRYLRWALAVVLVYYLVNGLSAIAIYHQKSNRWTGWVELIFPYPAAYVDRQVISLNRYQKEVNARLTYARTHNLPSEQPQVDQYVMTQLTNRILYQEALAAHHITVTSADINKSLNETYKEIGGEANLAKFLTENYGPNITLSDFQTWVSELLAESAVQHQLLTHVEISHILFALPDNPSPDQIEAARQKAVDLRGQITDANKFADFAKQYSEDVASRDKGGALGIAVRGDTAATFSPEFENIIFSTPVGAITNPIRTKYGWHIVLVSAKAGSIDMSMTDYTAQLRRQARIRLFFGQ